VHFVDIARLGPVRAKREFASPLRLGVSGGLVFFVLSSSSALQMREAYSSFSVDLDFGLGSTTSAPRPAAVRRRD